MSKKAIAPLALTVVLAALLAGRVVFAGAGEEESP